MVRSWLFEDQLHANVITTTILLVCKTLRSICQFHFGISLSYTFLIRDPTSNIPRRTKSELANVNTITVLVLALTKFSLTLYAVPRRVHARVYTRWLIELISTNNSLDQQKSHNGCQLNLQLYYIIFYIYIYMYKLATINSPISCLADISRVLRVLKYGCLGPATRRCCSVAARIIVIIVVVIVARFTGVAGAVELLVSNERAQIVEADVA